ncbi:MAG: YdcF family protein [Bacteroidetes bacterium]|nr:YdcF family protein [Bacteroidota bacterium]MBS1541513.1 YdcF family protein [Bacteroidota bacterium]
MLSKILAYAIMPVTVISLLLVASAFIKNPRRKKRFFIVALSLLLFFSNDFIANEAVLAWEIPLTPFSQIKKEYAYAIVLTGVTKHEPGFHDRVFFNRGADRVIHTMQLYKMGIVKKIVVSGGSGRLTAMDRKEADEMADALLLMGVRQEDILKEGESRNTRESAVAVKKMLQGITTPAECLLVTSAYHMRRSAACFKKVGWPMDTFTVDFLSHQRNFYVDTLLIPKGEAIGNWQIIIREWVGLMMYKLVGYA